MRKIIFLDVDGTLLDHEKLHTVPPSAIEALNQAKQKGHLIIVCTGRTKSNVHPDLLKFEADGYIYGAGTTVEVNNQRLFDAFFPKEEMDTILNQMNHYQFGYTLEGDEDSFRDPLAQKRSDLSHQSKQLDDYTAMVIGSEDTHFMIDEYKGSKMNKITLLVKDLAKLELFKQQFSQYEFLVHSLDTRGELNIYPVEMLLKGISKASGMDILLDYFKMDLADSLAYGDSVNDIEMIKHAHIGICMGNGSDALKAVADEVCGNTYEDGIYNSFKKHQLI